jgi:hypothetical protein
MPSVKLGSKLQDVKALIEIIVSHFLTRRVPHFLIFVELADMEGEGRGW